MSSIWCCLIEAGAFSDGASAQQLRADGLDPLASLGANHVWGAFNAIGDLFVTGPTGTDVIDFRAVLAGELPEQTQPFKRLVDVYGDWTLVKMRRCPNPREA